MKIDRSRFLALTASIGVATASCGAQDRVAPRIEIPPPPKPGQAAELVVPPIDAGTSLYASRQPATQAVPPSPPAACPENAIGTIAACDTWKVDPTCESGGPRSECTSLLDFGHPSADGEPEGFQPRVAEEIAKCMTVRPVTRASGCKVPDMHKCIRAGVDVVCIEPDMVTACEKLVARCNGRGRPPSFTVEQCAKIATATRGALREWALSAMSGLHADGTPMGEGCTLEYVTVYQPWPRNWWTGK